MDTRILRSIGVVIMGVAILIPLIVLVSSISLTGAVLLILTYGVGAGIFLIGEAVE